ncbi:MAG TPA: hypothetical protein VHF06_30580 [Pseudonocardiaceae bacterium]|nr:hypothetical protein [Pseudonocardiaceae bacterium]
MTEWDLVRAAFDRYDPVPADVRRAAERAAAFVGPRAALAAVDGMRGEQVLRFAGAAGRVVVEIECSDTVRLVGFALGVGGALWVRWPAGERPIAVDALGEFRVDGLPPGPLSIAVRRHGLPDAVSPWFVG